MRELERALTQRHRPIVRRAIRRILSLPLTLEKMLKEKCIHKQRLINFVNAQRG